MTKMLEQALAIKSARAFQDHLESVKNIQQMALDNNTEQLASVAGRQDVVEAMMEANQKSNEQLLQMMSRFVDMLEALQGVFARPLPPQAVTLEQQPVVVNVPKAAIEFSPQVNVPESQVTVHQQQDIPTKAEIRHSDGMRSTITFK